MKTERPDSCREWRHLLGAYALGDLSAEERAGLEAHLGGCPECRAEAESLDSVARLLPLADPDRFSRPAPQPSPDLGQEIAAAIGREQRVLRSHRRRRFGFAVAAAAATAAAVLALVVLPGGDSGRPRQHIEFASLPAGISIDATLEPHAYGTEIHMYVKGIRSGTLCRVYLRGPRGERVPAGTFTYRWGDDSTATLSSALDLSRAREIGVRAGNRTFVAPVDVNGATSDNSNQEEAT
ncbi:MAG TPA: zf-HC2 domain-containing protein [Solirubrobacterales bacterium]|nr:zf-HC2 domain-containing protein [Solirubrobacterales bacterium]